MYYRTKLQTDYYFELNQLIFEIYNIRPPYYQKVDFKNIADNIKADFFKVLQELPKKEIRKLWYSSLEYIIHNIFWKIGIIIEYYPKIPELNFVMDDLIKEHLEHMKLLIKLQKDEILKQECSRISNYIKNKTFILGVEIQESSLRTDGIPMKNKLPIELQEKLKTKRQWEELGYYIDDTIPRYTMYANAEYSSNRLHDYYYIEDVLKNNNLDIENKEVAELNNSSPDETTEINII